MIQDIDRTLQPNIMCTMWIGDCRTETPYYLQFVDGGHGK